MSEADSSNNGMIEGLAGIGVAVLAILGLAGLLSNELAAVAVIVTGVALASIGAAVAARYPDGSGGGVGVGLLGGIVAVVLGILALLDVSRTELLGVAVIVIGASLLLGSRLGGSSGASREAAVATASLQAMVGASGVALGILALSGIQTETLILVALLSFAGAILVGSAAVTGRMLTLIRA